MGWPDGLTAGVGLGVGLAVGVGEVGRGDGGVLTEGTAVGLGVGFVVGAKLYPGGLVGTAVGLLDGMYVLNFISSLRRRVNLGR